MGHSEDDVFHKIPHQMITHQQNQLKFSVLVKFKILYRIRYKKIDVTLVQCPFKIHIKSTYCCKFEIELLLITNTILEDWKESKVYSHGSRWRGTEMLCTLRLSMPIMIRMVYCPWFHKTCLLLTDGWFLYIPVIQLWSAPTKQGTSDILGKMSFWYYWKEHILNFNFVPKSSS